MKPSDSVLDYFEGSPDGDANLTTQALQLT